VAVTVVIASNAMIASGWATIGGVPPFDVRDDLAVALLLAPGLFGAIADWALFSRRGVQRN